MKVMPAAMLALATALVAGPGCSRDHSAEEAGRKIDGANDLTFTYDTAERLTEVKETGNSGRILKTFTYGPDNGVNDWRLGKLQKTRRNNYLTLSGTAYTVSVYAGSILAQVVRVSGSPVPEATIIAGLANGTSYTFYVSATNRVGTGPLSLPSTSVVPSGLFRMR